MQEDHDAWEGWYEESVAEASGEKPTGSTSVDDPETAQLLRAATLELGAMDASLDDKKGQLKESVEVETSSTCTPSRSPDSSGTMPNTSTDETWVSEWDPEWGSEETWVSEWDPAWDGEEWTTWDQGESAGTPDDTPEVARELVFDLETSPATSGEPPKDPWDECDEVNGLFWDPIGLTNVELGVLMEHGLHEDGSWTAYYSGLDGHIYSLTRLASPEPTPVEKSATHEGKIKYTPVSKDDIREFSQNAWPANGQPTGSGLNQQDRSATPTAEQVEKERLKYPDQSPEKIWEGAKSTLLFGTRPETNPNPMDLAVLQGMTLKEHMVHVEWYATPSDFKAKIHPDIELQLWDEMIEVYKMVNIYGIKNAEHVLLALRTDWAHRHNLPALTMTDPTNDAAGAKANWLKREWCDPNGTELVEWELDVPLAIKQGDVLTIKSTSAVWESRDLRIAYVPAADVTDVYDETPQAPEVLENQDEAMESGDTKEDTDKGPKEGPARTTADPDEFYLKLPTKTVSDALHLPARCAQMFAGVNLLQKPFNPHRQKLLAASKRTAKVDAPGMEVPEPKAKAKSKKAKAPKGSPKANPKAVPKVKAGKTSEMKEIQEKAKNDYNGAKKTFFESMKEEGISRKEKESRWNESQERRDVVASMPEWEAKRRRYM